MKGIQTMIKELWNFLCSLKLAIVLASLSTLIIGAGSMVMPAHPEIFGDLDRMTLTNWYAAVASQHPLLTWWLPVAGLLLISLGVNTLCCFCDWLMRLRSRWRKTGEYLIHLGFILLLAGYLWGAWAGNRTEGLRLPPGKSVPLPAPEGYALRLEDFRALTGPGGRPIDMISDLSLLRGEEVVARKTVRTNHPLLYQGLVVVPLSFATETSGFRFLRPGRGLVDLVTGETLELSGQERLEVLDFAPHVLRQSNGRVRRIGDQLRSPAFLLELRAADKQIWKGWYLLREGLPEALEHRLNLRPVGPLENRISVVTANYDPGAGLAMAGGACLTAGALFAFFSYYRKRRRQERPEVI